MDKLSDAELLSRRDIEVAATLSLVGDADGGHELALQAIEFVASRRGLPPLRENYNRYSAHDPKTRRLNVMVLIEKGVRETGSFEGAIEKLSQSREIEWDVEFFKTEAERFKREFRSQARLTSERMLDGSLTAIGEVLASYGIPPDSAARAARRVYRGGDVDIEAATVVRAATLSPNVDAPSAQRHRFRLAQWVTRLKQQQKKVAALTDAYQPFVIPEPRRLGPDIGTGNESDMAFLDYAGAPHHAALVAAQQELQTLWIQAERLHPVLAAYRHGGDIETVDLGHLDTDPVDKQMQSVVAKVLPTIADVAKAKDYINQGKVSPLSIPSVVALTRATMFIPEGSIRSGIVNDLAADAAEGEPWWVKAAAIALALVTLIPSGGTSIGIVVGVAGVSLAAYSAAKAYAEYSKQKTFADTNMDIARSLSNEEPSLTGFAVSLVSLGLEAIPLVHAFNEARRIKALVNAGEDYSAAVTELNTFGESHGAHGLGDDALRDIRQQTGSEDAARAASTHTIPPDGPPEVPVEIRGVPTGDSAGSIMIRPAVTPSLLRQQEAATLRRTEAALLERRPRLASELRQQRDLERSLGLQADAAAKRADKTAVRRLEAAFDARQKRADMLEAQLHALDDELAHVRTRIAQEAPPPPQPPQLRLGKLREPKVAAAFHLSPKNNLTLRNLEDPTVSFIPDHIEGNPKTLTWGRPYHFKEIKDVDDLSVTGNLKLMLNYVETTPGARLTLYYKKGADLSGPLIERIGKLKKAGRADLIPFER